MTDREPRDLPTIPTRVSHADFGDNRFCGFGVIADLAGRDGIWSTNALALGAARVTPETARLLDLVSTAAIAADPRIWPMKVSRLLTAYGRWLPGLVGPLLAMEGGGVGPPAVGDAAHLLEDMRAALDAAGGSDAAFAELLGCALATRGRLPGFGVPYRPRDERIAPIAAELGRLGLDQRPHWSLMLRIEADLAAQRGVQANIGAAMSAVCLDEGFTADQVEILCVVMLINNLVANASEGAQQAPEVLKRLPAQAIRYVGPPPRKSPRASAQAADQSPE